MRNILLFAGLLVSNLPVLAEAESQTASLPELKATVRFHSESGGALPDSIDLPQSTLLMDKQRRVIEGALGQLPIRIYIRETPDQPRPLVEVNLVDTQTNRALAGYPARQDVGPLGMLSFNVPVTAPELETLVGTTKKSAEGKLGKVDSVSLHIDVDIPVNPETNADGNLILDCEDLLRQDDFVVDDVSEKMNDTSNGGVRSVADAYIECLNKQTETLSNQLKPNDKQTVDRVRQLLPDLAPVGFGSAMNANGGIYFSMLALASVSVDIKQAETANRLARQLGQSSIPNPEARKAVSIAFASCQTALKKMVPAPENPGDGVNTADLKKQFQSNLAKAKTALKVLQKIAAKLPDNSAEQLAQSTLTILTMAQSYE